MREARRRTQCPTLQTISTRNSRSQMKEGKGETESVHQANAEDLEVKEEARPKMGQCKQTAVKLNHTSGAVSPLSLKSRKRPLSPVKARGEGEDLSSDSEVEEEELDYETMREKNIRDNEAFFSSLGIQMAKEQLKLSGKKYPKPSQQRVLKKKEVLPRRKSLRIQRIDPTGLPLPPQLEPEPLVNDHPPVPPGPLSMQQAAENETEDHTAFCQSLGGVTAAKCLYKPLTADLSSFVSDMKRLCISTKAKVCKDRLFSIAVHPNREKILSIAGDKWGRLGFWDISAQEQERSVVTYRPHSRPIGHIVVPPTHPLTVYSCSYDSTLRCCHIEKGVFEELYSVPEEDDDLFRNFDFLSPTTLLLAQFRGQVAVLDTRTPGQKAVKLHHVSEKYLRTVSVHPTNSNFFCTASTDMTVSVWDLRRLSTKGNKPLHAMTHGRSVSSAYFSPLTGRRILTCSADDTLNIYSCSSSCGEVSGFKTISHNNKTGRWLTPFRAVWHPAREDVFFVGSMKSPRRIEAFGLDGRLLHEFQGDVLSSVCSVVQFHPSQKILVGGNSSGYVFPFM